MGRFGDNIRLSSSRRLFDWSGVVKQPSWAAKSLGISGQTPHDWVKAEAAGRPREVAGKTVSAKQMEIARLKAELAKARMERDILKKRRRILRGSRGEIRLYRATSHGLADSGAMSGAEPSAFEAR